MADDVRTIVAIAAPNNLGHVHTATYDEVRARLSEGWCPWPTHPRLGKHLGYSCYCQTCETYYERFSFGGERRADAVKVTVRLADDQLIHTAAGYCTDDALRDIFAGPLWLLFRCWQQAVNAVEQTAQEVQS